MRNMITERRIGKFKVAQYIVRELPDELISILQHFLIVKTEALFECDAIEYTAYSNLLPSVSEGSMAPRYEVYCGYNDVTKENYIKEIKLVS